MNVVGRIVELRRLVSQARAAGQVVGFVPTMGALHQGHRSLIAQARQRCGFVVVSIFVNPTQFGPEEDLEAYPCPLDADLAACQADGVDLVFHPEVAEIYPEPAVTVVQVHRLTDRLCGLSRPGHFDGVATVVLKLLNIVAPQAAFFGEKDYQQLMVVDRMVRDLNLPVDIVSGPTVREPDGLALSSRNAFLTESQRRQAAVLYNSMVRAAGAQADGQNEVPALIAGIEADLRASGPITIDYVRIVDPETLEDLTQVAGPARICLAVKIGRCRLIDNLAMDSSVGSSVGSSAGSSVGSSVDGSV